jgi:hypothetical protein
MKRKSFTHIYNLCIGSKAYMNIMAWTQIFKMTKYCIRPNWYIRYIFLPKEIHNIIYLLQKKNYKGKWFVVNNLFHCDKGSNISISGFHPMLGSFHLFEIIVNLIFLKVKRKPIYFIYLFVSKFDTLVSLYIIIKNKTIKFSSKLVLIYMRFEPMVLIPLM